MKSSMMGICLMSGCVVLCCALGCGPTDVERVAAVSADLEEAAHCGGAREAVQATALEGKTTTPDPCAAASLGDGDYCARSLDPLSTSATLYTCVRRATANTVACTSGCTVKPAGQSDVCAPEPDPCAKATLGDGDYCSASLNPASTKQELHRCTGGRSKGKQACAFGCKTMPAGKNDVCSADPNAPAAPRVTISAAGMYFSEATVRGPIESGLSYMLSRLASQAGTTGTVTPIRITYSVSNNAYCSGSAGWDSTDISCPWNYPVQGDNQNYVMNLTMHEIGHILAAQLFGSPAGAGRDLCENEGIASWIAGKYWMNAYPAVAVGSLRQAALDDVARDRAWLSMGNCVSASDGWYTVYASFFEYLEKNVPDGVRKVATGAVSQSSYIAGWKAWMQQ